MKLYVGSLSYSTTEDQLLSLFSDYGSVETVSIVRDRFSDESKGFGFVDIPNNSQADKAIKALNGSSFQGRLIKVNQAQPKSKSSGQKWRNRY